MLGGDDVVLLVKGVRAVAEVGLDDVHDRDVHTHHPHQVGMLSK